MAAAAFYDLEGTLVSTNLVHTLGFYARNQQGILRSIKKSAATLVSIPLFAVADSYSRMVFNDIFFRRYKGETEDRLRFFAEDLFENVLKPAVFPGAKTLIQKSRSLGLRQVVITGALDFSVKPLMEYLGVDDFVANRLEFVNGVATGRLLPPVLASATKASWIRTYAEREGLKPERLLRLQRQHERPAHALNRRPPRRGQPRHASQADRAPPRLADFESEMSYKLQVRSSKSETRRPPSTLNSQLWTSNLNEWPFN